MKTCLELRCKHGSVRRLRTVSLSPFIELHGVQLMTCNGTPLPTPHPERLSFLLCEHTASLPLCNHSPRVSWILTSWDVFPGVSTGWRSSSVLEPRSFTIPTLLTVDAPACLRYRKPEFLNAGSTMQSSLHRRRSADIVTWMTESEAGWPSCRKGMKTVLLVTHTNWGLAARPPLPPS